MVNSFHRGSNGSHPDAMTAGVAASAFAAGNGTSVAFLNLLPAMQIAFLKATHEGHGKFGDAMQFPADPQHCRRDYQEFQVAHELPPFAGHDTNGNKFSHCPAGGND
jgi:hypothetical protein